MVALNIQKTVPAEHILEILKGGKMDIRGQFIFGSNYSFLAGITGMGEKIEAVYKPLRGEVPLCDFPSETLAAREAAAFEISRALGWDFVPPTVIRQEAPLGKGSLQLFVPHNPDLNYFTFEEKIQNKLRGVVLFDMIINNADRKGSHILLDENEKIWLIDHGLCFHADPKLRTVIWDFSGQTITAGLIKDSLNLNEMLAEQSALYQSLTELLDHSEIKAMRSRIEKIAEEKTFPAPEKNRRTYPWPLV